MQDDRQQHAEPHGTFRPPLTPAMYVFLQGKIQRTRRGLATLLVVALVCLPFLLRTQYGWLAVLIIIGIVGYGTYNETVGRTDVRQNLREGTFTRYVGSLEVREERKYLDPDGTFNPQPRIHYTLTVPEQSFDVGSAVGERLRGGTWGAVDYLEEPGIGQPGGLLLEVRDAEGAVVYRHSDYHPT
ncbi:MAG: hypothetical protein LC793_18790 [Thermomicrobia bacterium]|nr:hypothetical protein [Thermomicrobia bacterium]